jgi:pyruvate dehydrogenase E2 component (dihydrolipoamide acetyltransferase)
MILVIKALASVLARHPRFNASLDPDSRELILKRYCHLGVAVDTDDGLLVGVVRDVDRQPIGRLAAAVDKMVHRVREREVSPEELRGSTFTVTNVGPLGGVAFEPLVNYPEVAILGMARARLQQVVTGDLDAPETAIRYMLPLSLSYDHRVNDGADAARFVHDLGESLRDPDALLLNV